MSAPETPLDELRREIDGIDDSLHDLIMRRAALVQRIGQAKAAAGNGASPLRPGREAAVLRRLVGRHQGPLPAAVVVRIWRELISAALRLQGPFAVAVHSAPGCSDLARDHFGSLTPLQPHDSGWQVLRAVAEGEAAVGVLPLPAADEPDPWWRHLIGRDAKAPRIVARLPFAELSPRGGAEAFAVARGPAEASGRDRSLVAIESAPQTSVSTLAGALRAGGLEPVRSLVWRDPQPGAAWLHLVEIDGFLAADDARLGRLGQGSEMLRRLWPVGGYAVPFTAAELAATAGS
jgi:chorismate mutase-like protein